MLLISFLLFPLLSFLNIFLFGARYGRWGSILFSGFFHSFILFFSFTNLFFYLFFLDYSTIILCLGSWFSSESLNVL